MNDQVRVPLRRRDGSVRAHAIIDEQDERHARHRWHVDSDGYVVRRLPPGNHPRCLLLHREILGLQPGDPREGDHRNGDRLDCRRSNLRVATTEQNGQNMPSRGGTSAHRGVSWDRVNRKWRAQAQLDGKHVNLGRFDDEQDAADAARAFRLAHMPFALADAGR